MKNVIFWDVDVAVCIHLLMLVPCSRIFLPLKRLFTQGLCSATSQKTAFSNLTYFQMSVKLKCPGNCYIYAYHRDLLTFTNSFSLESFL